MKNVALVLSGLLAGAAAGALLVPRVWAQGQRPAAVRWQQFCEPASSITEASTMSSARGLQGWELVGFFGGALCFKRPVLEAPRPGAPSLGDTGGPRPGDTGGPRPGDTGGPGNPYGI